MLIDYNTELDADDVKFGLIESNACNLLTIKETKEGTKILKYKPRVMFNCLWNTNIVRFGRGHSFSKDLTKLICNPFPKIFNVHEIPGINLDDNEICRVYVKRNGFMLSATYSTGELYISTTGTTDSDFAKLGRSWVEKNPELMMQMSDRPEYTFVFECCDKSNPHIVTEPEGLTLIGVRHNDLNAEFNMIHMFENKFREFVNVDKHFIMTFAEAKELVADVEHEGFVVQPIHNPKFALKLKSPYYLILKKIARSHNMTGSIQQLRAFDFSRSFAHRQWHIDFVNEIVLHKPILKELSEQDRLDYLKKMLKGIK